jgi:hypothetical protein
MSTRLRIISAMQQIAREQQITLPPLEADLSLHETVGGSQKRKRMNPLKQQAIAH